MLKISELTIHETRSLYSQSACLIYLCFQGHLKITRASWAGFRIKFDMLHMPTCSAVAYKVLLWFLVV